MGRTRPPGPLDSSWRPPGHAPFRLRDPPPRRPVAPPAAASASTTGGSAGSGGAGSPFTRMPRRRLTVPGLEELARRQARLHAPQLREARQASAARSQRPPPVRRGACSTTRTSGGTRGASPSVISTGARRARGAASVGGRPLVTGRDRVSGECRRGPALRPRDPPRSSASRRCWTFALSFSWSRAILRASAALSSAAARRLRRRRGRAGGRWPGSRAKEFSKAAGRPVARSVTCAPSSTRASPAARAANDFTGPGRRQGPRRPRCVSCCRSSFSFARCHVTNCLNT